MKHTLKRPLNALAATLAAALQLASHAAVPLAWEARPGNPAPAQFTRYHGETLALRCTLAGFDGDLSAQGDVRLWFQTNGMGRLWWSAPATAASNRIEATFGAAEDVGADRVSLFLGSPSNVYASAVLRLMPSPGFTPANLSLPVLRLDFDALAVTNAPYYTKAETDAKIVELSPPTSLEPATNYTDGVASALMGGISRKADMYRYESGAASNALVSCDWWHSSARYTLVEREDMGENTWYFSSGSLRPPRLGGPTSTLTYQTGVGWVLVYGSASSGDTYATNQQDRAAAVLDFGSFTLVRTNEVWAAGTNRYPVVYRDELRGAITTVVTKSYVEDLGIESGLQEETDPIWSAEKSGYATVDALGEVGDAARTAQGAANALSNRVSALETWAVGDETALSVTDAGTSNATLRISYTNRVMYSSAAERTNTVNEAKAYTDGKTAEVVSAVDAALATKANRAWGETTSGGAPSPADTLYVEKQKVTITGGGNYAYLASSTGGYWVLSVSLGSEWTMQALADAQNPTNPATASFIDADGNAAWTVTSTGTRLAYAEQGQQYIYVEDVGGNDVVTITYPITADDHPTCLYDPECIAGKDMREASAANFPDYIALVEWSGHSGEWVCRVTMNGKPGRGFFAAKYIKTGTVYTKYEKPLGIQTVVIGRDEYRVHVETMNGKKVMVLEDL